MAAWLFILGGDRSIGSSVMLKSPNKKSGFGRRFALLSRSSSAQKAGCSLTLFGAYMFSIIISVSDHFILIIIARPCFSTYVFTFVGAISALFIRKATPADPRGFVGSLEFITSKLLLKHRLMSVSRSSSRWVSCSASIAIFSVLIVLFIVAHLSMWFMFCVGVVAPFKLSVAIIMFALFLGGFRSLFSLAAGFSFPIWFTLSLGFSMSCWFPLAAGFSFSDRFALASGFSFSGWFALAAGFSFPGRFALATGFSFTIWFALLAAYGGAREWGGGSCVAGGWRCMFLVAFFFGSVMYSATHLRLFCIYRVYYLIGFRFILL